MLHPFFAFLFQGDPNAPQGSAPAGGSAQQPQMPGLFDGPMVPMLLCMLVVFWFFILGPERKNRKKREEMLKALKKGDEVLTGSGVYGSVVQVHEGVVTLQVADGVRMRFAQSAITSIIPDEPTATKN